MPPAMASHAGLFFQGSVLEAINAAKERNSLLFVLLTGE